MPMVLTAPETSRALQTHAEKMHVLGKELLRTRQKGNVSCCCTHIPATPCHVLRSLPGL